MNRPMEKMNLAGAGDFSKTLFEFFVSLHQSAARARLILFSWLYSCRIEKKIYTVTSATFSEKIRQKYSSFFILTVE